jgi:hypothetical protein
MDPAARISPKTTIQVGKESKFIPVRERQSLGAHLM